MDKIDGIYCLYILICITFSVLEVNWFLNQFGFTILGVLFNSILCTIPFILTGLGLKYYDRKSTIKTIGE